mmetsp:Transcript_28268/g.21126  ORF Transcript_28268/g.21126 Transcript_28268/m.21126 type:complete len:85 (+) Transcript_28268:937-1191(+)
METLFEEITEEVKLQCDESLMPFEEDDLKQFVENIVMKSNRKLSEKLADISDVLSLVELRQEFERRIRNYFKTILENNKNESST